MGTSVPDERKYWALSWNLKLINILGGFREISKMPCKRIFLSIVALLGKLEGALLPGFLSE